jgi:hypothetical protein
MTTLPNDDFDMCCGSRPHVTEWRPGCYGAECGICGDRMGDNRQVRRWELMIEWNKRQRSKL